MDSRIFLAALLALGACADRSEPDPAPAEDEAPYNMIDPVVNPVAGDVVPPQSGEWAQGSVEGRDAIVFTPAAGEAVLAMFCDERDGIVVERRGLLPSGPYEMMDLALGNVRVSLAAHQVGDGDPVQRATIPFNSELYTRLRDFDGIITVSAGQAQPVAVPASPLIGELVRTCTTAGGE